jgi:hypothetical protein
LFADMENCFILVPLRLCYPDRDAELTISNCKPLSFRVIKVPSADACRRLPLPLEWVAAR